MRSVNESLRLWVTALAPFLFAVTFFVITLLGTGVLLYGSVSAAAARICGDILYSDAPRIDVGTVVSGGQVSAGFPIRNLTGTAVTLVGIRTDCGCVVPEEFPIEIGPGGLCNLNLTVQLPKVTT